MIALILVMVLLVAFAGCSNNNQGKSSPSASEDSFELKLGFDTDHPPFTYVNSSDEYTGFDIDLAEAVCKHKGWSLKLVPIDWTDKDVLIDSNSIDCVWSAFTMEGRDHHYHFTEPYMIDDESVVVKADSNINALSDLAGKNVISQADSSALAELMTGNRASLRETFASLHVTISLEEAFNQLDSGEVDAVACDGSIMKYYISQNPSQYRILSEPLSTDHYAVGVSKEDAWLVDEINEVFKHLKKDGTFDKLCDKYSKFGIERDDCVI